MIATSPIKEVVIRDTIHNRDHRFVFSDYIEATEKPEKDFYEILQSGKALLYKQYKKRILESKPYGSTTTEQSIKTDIRFYLLLNKKWTRVKKIKELPDFFPGKRNEIQKFINDKKLTEENETSYGAVISCYNTLVGQQ